MCVNNFVLFGDLYVPGLMCCVRVCACVNGQIWKAYAVRYCTFYVTEYINTQQAMVLVVAHTDCV